MAKRRGDQDPGAVKLSAWVVGFVNAVWNRKLRSSRDLVDGVFDALEEGYSEDHIRSVYWVAATLPGDEFAKDALRNAMSPAVLVRFHGRVNNQTGKPAVRWLDVLGARVEETSPRLISGVLEKVKKECGAGAAEQEAEFLKRVGFPVEETEAKP